MTDVTSPVTLHAGDQELSDKGLRVLFETGNTRGVAAAHVQKLTDILDLLNTAATPGQLDFPGAFLHPLKGKLKGFWAVRVSGNWRVVFRMERGDAFDVDYTDYH